MASFLENLFGGGYDPTEQADASLNQANSQANAPDAQGASVQGVGNVDLGPNGEASSAAANDAAVAAGGARSQAQGAAGAAGLSGAAAANAGAAAGSNAYGSTYSSLQPQLAGQQVNERGQTLGANESTAENKTNASMTNTNAQATERGQNLGYATNMAGVGQANAQNIGNAEGQLLSAGATLGSSAISKSDKNQKKDFSGYGDLLDSVAKNIKGYQYNYKESSGENPNHRELGVMAQDLEKTPLKSSVMDTPNGKMVDTNRLTTANTAMISDLSRKLDKAFEYIGKVK